MARATKCKGQAINELSRLVPRQEDRSPSGPSIAVPLGAAGGLVLGDLPGPATLPEFGESVANVVHVPAGAQPHTYVSGSATANTSAIVSTSLSLLSVPLISSMPVSAAQSLTNIHDNSPLTSVCDDLGLGVPKQTQEKIWNGEYVDFGTLSRPVRGGCNTPQD